MLCAGRCLDAFAIFALVSAGTRAPYSPSRTRPCARYPALPLLCTASTSAALTSTTLGIGEVKRQVGQRDMFLNALLTAIAAIAGADIARGDCYLLCRIASTGTVSSPGSRPAPPPALGGLATAEPHTAAPSSGSEGICPSGQTCDVGNLDSPLPDWTTPRT